MLLRASLVLIAVAGCPAGGKLRVSTDLSVTFRVWKRIAVDTGGLSVTSNGAADVPDLMIKVNHDAIEPGVAVDLVYVVDTTNSMRDDIDEAQHRMHEILGDLTARNPDRRVGIVAYRDRGDEYEARMVMQLDSSETTIKRGIDALTVAGGGDEREHVYAGLDLALRQQPWRAGATHHIILMGDAPPHEDYYGDPRTHAMTVELARAHGVRIHTIGVHSGGLVRRPAQPTSEATIDPDLRRRASVNGKYAGLIGTFRASEDVEEYGEYRDDGYWKGGTYKAKDQPAGYWVYVAPTWYVWSRQAPTAEKVISERP